MAGADAAARKLRAICLALPEATEKQAWGDPTFRIRGKIFAMQKRGDGRLSVWCKCTPDTRDALLLSAPSLFFIPPYVGPKGWVGMRLDDDPNWEEVASLVRESYRLIAPRKLGRLVEL